MQNVDKMDSRIGVAIFGFGRMGRLHAKNLVHCRQYCLLYIVDEYAETVKSDIAKPEWNLPFDHATQVLKPEDSRIVFADEKVKGVIICTPTPLHQCLIAEACQYKKHVFCEKPIAPTVEDTVKCYQLAQAAEVTLFCGFNRRFDPSFGKMKKHIADGNLGKLQLISSSCRDHPEPPETFFIGGSGGMFADMAIHNIDLINWMTGEYPTHVTAMGHAHKATYEKQNDIDAFGVMLKYPSGLIAYIDSCRYAPYGYDQRFEVVGQKGAATVENPREDAAVFRNEQGDVLSKIAYSFPERYNESYLNEILHFAQILRGETTCSVSEASAINTIRIALAAQESYETKTIVDVVY